MSGKANDYEARVTDNTTIETLAEENNRERAEMRWRDDLKRNGGLSWKRAA